MRIIGGKKGKACVMALAILFMIPFVFFGCTPKEDSTPKTYQITVSPNNSDYGTVTGGGSFAEGTEITIKAFPNSGYYFESWSDGNQEAIRDITVTSDKSYTAIFKSTKPTVKYRLANVKFDMFITSFNGVCGATKVNLSCARVYMLDSNNMVGNLLAGVNEDCQAITDTTGETFYDSENSIYRDLNNPIIANGKNIAENVFEEGQTVQLYIIMAILYLSRCNNPRR